MIRALVFALTVLLLLPTDAAWGLAVIVPSSSPFVALTAVLSEHDVSGAVWMGLVVGGIATVRRRWFCRWMCPVGLLADTAARAGLRCGCRARRIAPVGQWVLWSTVGGALVGYPVLVWLDPLALYSGSFTIVNGSTSGAAWWSWVGLATVLIASAVWPGLWCARICPLGAMQDYLSGIRRGIHRFVPARAHGRIGAVSLSKSAGSNQDTPIAVSRRFLLGTLIGAVWASAARAVHGKVSRPLRPPGAREETRFVGLCIRCGNCVRVCPARIIRPDGTEHGVAGLLAPILDFREDYCREDCTRCTQVCPSGALARLTVEDKSAAVIGVARVDMELCLLRDDRECSACRSSCPYDAITYVWADADYMTTVQVDPEKCPGCGACEQACPTRPTKAITVQPQRPL